ncbi:hypothetical protein A7978_04710 (plasmid) [Borrelia turicatae]|uniref:Uncharacterized protein n=1 Tax=Borrelia turicatae TaxID=142 RepID=A0A172XCL3_BORTU|nr:hypothetical protein [Borrelia turicatae]ANF34414.1 hypothetical protein A7978_04710 [Borrelia turicatae]UPA15491.1 hypothetical protein btBTE5EL_001173 [Borrelia turicatae]
MLTQVISRMCLLFSFYVLDVFLLSVDFKTYCDKENFYCYKEYLEEFKSGSIGRIFFRRIDVVGVYRDLKVWANKQGWWEYGKNQMRRVS